jgi:hypothetical protein
MPAPLNLIGQTFGLLTVIRRIPGPTVTWECRCKCGGSSTPTTINLRKGNSASCGCRKRNVLGESTTKHGLNKHELYHVWKAMKQRCYNPKNKGYKNYGARGVTVDPVWKDDFPAFVRDMGNRPVGGTLERVDNDGPYSKDNCIWASRAQQAKNTRAVKRITVGGVTLCHSDWARSLGVSVGALSRRIKRMGEENAIRELQVTLRLRGAQP